MGVSSRIVFLSAVTLLLACGSSSDSSPAGDSADGGTTPPVDHGPPALDGVPTEGVFVWAAAPAGGDGSLEHPLQTIAAGIALAKTKKTIVNVCKDTYTERVAMGDGVSLYGFFICPNGAWQRKDDTRTQIAGSITAQDLQFETHIEGVEVAAPDAPQSSTSDADAASIALVVKNVRSLVVNASVFTSGAGRPGVDGTDGPQPQATSETAAGRGLDFQSTNCTAPNQFCTSSTSYPGGSGATRTCAVGTVGAGGVGGKGKLTGRAIDPAASNVDVKGNPLASSAAASAGELREASFVAGPAGLHGTTGANGKWNITADGFVRGNGTAGANGTGGGGGGGSAGSGFVGAQEPYKRQTASGSGGGAGGCPGLAGTPGTGGGASIAALVVDSTATFTATTLHAGSGGRGGAGTLGSAGTAGSAGAAGANDGLVVLSKGQDGGAGGDAGLSGHGAPGPSIALAYHGARPKTDTATLTSGQAAAGSAALTRGTQSLPATIGDALAEYNF